VSREDRIAVAALALAGVAAVIAVVILASQLCPAPTPADPCPDADRNRLIVVGLAAVAVFCVMTPAAFVGDYLVHDRIAAGPGSVAPGAACSPALSCLQSPVSAW
jgi:hypothetical protein